MKSSIPLHIYWHRPLSRFWLLGFVLCCCSLSGLGAQERLDASSAMIHQFTAKDNHGDVLPNTTLHIRVLVKAGEPEQVVYEESHQVQSDSKGLVYLKVGEGTNTVGSFSEVPWTAGNVILEKEVITDPSNPFRISRARQVWSVPYAFHAIETGEIMTGEEVKLRNAPSIHWLTSGNDGLQEAYPHRLGTNDARDLVFKTNGITRMVISADGQLYFHSGGITGNVNSKGSYPMVVEGSTQGVYIEIDENRDSGNNFLTFTDTERILGAVEGQTESEWRNSEPYKDKTLEFILTGVALGAMIAANTTEAAGWTASTFGVAAGAAKFALVAVVVAESISFAAAVLEWQTTGQANLGVNYNTGGADYAEYLPLAPETTDLVAGQIVGVHSGQVSLRTDSTSVVKVVSANPIVLGNLPKDGETKGFEPIALLGQVPVWVAGPVRAGDYILPTGNNDGLGRAISPEAMQLADYRRVVGIAWEDAPEKGIHQVVTGIGLHRDLMAKHLDGLEQKLGFILEELHRRNGNDASAIGQGLAKAFNTNDSRPALAPLYSEEAFNKMVDEHAGGIKASFQLAEEHIRSRGINPDEYPFLTDFLNDPITSVKKLRKDPALLTNWALFDQQISEYVDTPQPNQGQ
jgi:hypothetical protein